MRFVALLFVLFLAYFTQAQSFTGVLSVDALHQVLQQGKSYQIRSSLMFDGAQEKLSCRYQVPKEFYKIVNKKGETTVYMPKENTVSFSQNNHSTSNTELLYFFLNNHTDDLGLLKEGFQVARTRREGPHLIITWRAPATLSTVNEVDLVFKDNLPIYAEYRSAQAKVLRKLYYYDYYAGPMFNLPQKVTEITFVSPQDSIIKRLTYTNIKLGQQVDKAAFQFEVPANAKKLN